MGLRRTSLGQDGLMGAGDNRKKRSPGDALDGGGWSKATIGIDIGQRRNFL